MLNFILKSERVGLTVLDDLTWNYPEVSCDRRVTARIADAISPIHIFSIGESKVDTVVMGCKIKPFIESYFTKHSSPTFPMFPFSFIEL